MRADKPKLEIVGRDLETSQITALIDEARHGRSGALVLRGEAGVGKTTLLDYAASLAGDMLLLRTDGVDAESDLAFAGLYGLLRPILSGLKQLVETQASALAGALGLAPSAGTDRFLISAAVLGLLAAAAEQRPVVCLIDDAQWVDRPSADALLFAARRLQAERIAMLFGAREGELRRFEGSGLPELVLTGVDERSAASILALSAAEAAPEVRERLLGDAAGNPLALVELPLGLADGQLAGLEPLPDAIPLTPRLHALFRQRIDQLPADTQTALLVVAADNTGELAAVLRAASEFQLTSDALDPAERAGLIRTDHTTIEFRHPLVRSAVYEAAPLGRRQRAHAALAAVLSGDQHVDRRVWHQAMASVGGDEEVAAALEASGRRAQLRAGHASAATAFQRAAELTLDESRRGRRFEAGARAAWAAGQAGRARELIARALPIADEVLRPRLLHLRGVIEWRCGNTGDAVKTLAEAADTIEDPSLILEILQIAVDAAAAVGDATAVRKFGDRATPLHARSARDRFSKAVVTGYAALFAREHKRASTLLSDALRQSSELDDPVVQLAAARAATVGHELGAGLPFATRAVELARQQGLLSVLPAALDQQAAELARNSQFDLGYAAAEEGYRLSIELGQGMDWHLVTMARVDATLGRETVAREHAQHGMALARQRGDQILSSATRAILGLLELTLGKPDEAAAILLKLVASPEPGEILSYSLAPLPDAVEAVVRSGLPIALVGEPLSRYRAFVLEVPTDIRRSLLARCEALTEERPPDEAFGEAIKLAGALPAFERARTALLFGEWLRRQRRRADARVHLRAALEVFLTLGASPWAARAEGELRATGERARKREPSTLDQLTPQELSIAGLVAEGMTNREIAAQLFLSPRTIEYHLRKVFSKIGIASRSELIRDGLPPRDPR